MTTARSSDDDEQDVLLGGLGHVSDLDSGEEVDPYRTLYLPDLSSPTGYSVHRVPTEPESGRRIGFRR